MTETIVWYQLADRVFYDGEVGEEIEVDGFSLKGLEGVDIAQLNHVMGEVIHKQGAQVLLKFRIRKDWHPDEYRMAKVYKKMGEQAHGKYETRKFESMEELGDHFPMLKKYLLGETFFPCPHPVFRGIVLSKIEPVGIFQFGHDIGLLLSVEEDAKLTVGLSDVRVQKGGKIISSVKVRNGEIKKMERVEEFPKPVDRTDFW